jgi:hypothetical protein
MEWIATPCEGTAFRLRRKAVRSMSLHQRSACTELTRVESILRCEPSVLFRREFDVPNPEAHRRPSNAERRRDLLERHTLLPTEPPCFVSFQDLHSLDRSGVG